MDLAELVEQGMLLVEAQEDVERLEKDLKNAKESVRNLSEDVLPAMLDELGLEEIKLANGARIAVERVILVQPRADNRAAIIEWLVKIGQGALVKNEVTAAFSVGEGAAAKSLLEELKRARRNAQTRQWVEPQTLKRVVREMVAAGADLPAELLGLETKRQAIFAEKARVEPCPFGSED